MHQSRFHQEILSWVDWSRWPLSVHWLWVIRSQFDFELHIAVDVVKMCHGLDQKFLQLGLFELWQNGFVPFKLAENLAMRFGIFCWIKVFLNLKFDKFIVNSFCKSIQLFRIFALSRGGKPETVMGCETDPGTVWRRDRFICTLMDLIRR